MAAPSYSFQNTVRDLSEIMDTIIQKQPRFISLFPTRPAAKATTHEWLEDQIAPNTVTVTEISNSVATMSSADVGKIEAGSILRIKDDPALFEVSAISGTSVTLTLAGANGSDKTMPSADDVLFISYTPKEKGSSDGIRTFHQSGTGQNYTQIFRADAELTGTDMAVNTYDRSNNLNYQVNIALQNMTRELNNAALFGTPRSLASSTRGMAGGLFYFGSQTGGMSINASGSAIDSYVVNDAGQQIIDQGGNGSIIVCSPGQARVLSSIMKENVIVNQDAENRGVYVQRIVNDITGTPQTIFTDPMIPDTVAFLIDPTGLGLVPLSGRQIQDSDATTNASDSIRRKIIGEYTFEFKNAKQRISRIYGLMGSSAALASKRGNVRSVRVTNTASDPVYTSEVAAGTGTGTGN